MHALLVDPGVHSIEALDIDTKAESIRFALRCKAFSVLPIGKCFVYHDDHGLYRPMEVDGRLPAVLFQAFPQPIVGRVLCLGWPNSTGEDTPCPYTISELKPLVRFVRVNPRAILNGAPDV